ncbi:MAG: hypothetical protein ACE5OZ_17615 [Candidatus Heimdallarchaeota archaeon]
MQYKWIILSGLVIAFIVTSTALLSFSLLTDDKDEDQVSGLIWGQSAYENAPRDPYTINNAKIDNDIMYIEVSFGGGCKAHNFTLIVLSGFGESLPVAANALLSHDGNNDSCEAWLTKELRFDLSSLKEEYQNTYGQESGAIRILLNPEGDLPFLEILYEF